MKDIVKFADEQAQARFAENQEIARKNRAITAELSASRTEKEALQEELDGVRRELDLYKVKNVKRPDWMRAPKSTKENHGTLLAMLSDTHYGEVVSEKELGGYNKYDLKIAEQRTERFFRRTIILARDYLAGVKYDGIYLALNGDIVSGDIHDELVETNALSTFETILWAIPRLAAGIEMWAKEFGKVHVVSAPGNHGRDSVKPRYKKRSAHNADSAIARHLAREFEKDDRVSFDVPESMDADFSIYSARFTMQHGDELMKNFSGSAEIGSLGPMKRGTLRKLAKKTVQGRPFDYALISHFHQYIPATTQGFIANGSVKGYDEYASGGQFKPEPPQQALMVVTPEFNITTQMPVFVAERKTEKW